MPMQRHLYPKDWDAIALSIKTAANWQCQHCGKECRRSKESKFDFIARVYDLREEAWEEAADHPQRFTLTVAHYPDPTPSNCSLDNLLALCAPCHLKLDAPSHTVTKRRNMRSRLEEQGQLTLEIL